jgi:septal ring-binding cell division protein DamX
MDKEPVKKKLEPKKEVKNTSGEEYSVQVLSSISKQEADKALKNLQSKGISSASISKKSLNGKTWYRVRFGSFEDRKQAQGAAKKAGYSNSWVDRVK